MTTADHFTERTDIHNALAGILTSWPLYRVYLYHDDTDTKSLPAVVQMYCDRELCGKETIWETLVAQNPNHRGWHEQKEYTCRNCKTSKVTFHFHWHIFGKSEPALLRFVKFGQWPALEKRISPELKKHLGGTDYELYQKALRCRSQALGIGALAYMRRVVENRTNELLDMLATEAMQTGGSADLPTKIEEAKKSFKFSDKIEFAKKIIPSTLRPGGHNPIDQLHDISSEGLHWKSEEECAVMFDKARGVFEFLFQEMERRKVANAEFHKQLSDIATRNS